MVSNKKRLLNPLLMTFLLLTVSVFPVLFLYFRNTLYMEVQEIWQPMLLYACAGLLSFGISLPFVRSWGKACLFAMIFSLVFANYIFVEKTIKFFANAYYWHCIPLVLAGLLFVLVFLKNKLTNDMAVNFCRIVGLSFFALILINFATAAPNLIRMANVSVSQEKVPGQTQPHGAEKLPNIYLMIYDEYSGKQALEHNYSYDNSDFYNRMQALGFTISHDSYNESETTSTVLHNLLSLEYIVHDDMSVAEKQEATYPLYLYTLLGDIGYTVRGVGFSEYLGVESQSEKSVVQASTIEGTSFSQLLYSNTMLYPFLSSKSTDENVRTVNQAFDYLLWEENIPSEPTFTIQYLKTPHQPFLFDQDGNLVSSANQNNWDDPSYYLNQLKYVSGRIAAVSEFIVRHDPQSIIIIQSDHGARGSGTTQLELRKNILNMVYFGGEAFDDIQGQSGINTLRAILNQAFGLELELLEAPDYE